MIRGVRPHTSGYTLVELLIVLSVSVALLSSAIAIFNGRIPASQFDKALNQLELKVSSTQNEVVSGFYPSIEKISCDRTNGVQELTLGNVSARGTNQECVFLGRMLQFTSKSDADTCNPSGSQIEKENCDSLKIYTVYGNRNNSSGKPSATLAEAQPRLIDGTISSARPEIYTIGFGMYIDKVKLAASTTPAGTLSGIGFIQTFGQQVGGTAVGNTQVNVHTIGGSMGMGMGIPESSFTDSVRVTFGGSVLNDPGGVLVCLRSTSIKKFAILTIGEGSNPARTNVRVFNDESSWSAQCS